MAGAEGREREGTRKHNISLNAHLHGGARAENQVGFVCNSIGNGASLEERYWPKKLPPNQSLGKRHRPLLPPATGNAACRRRPNADFPHLRASLRPAEITFPAKP